MKRKLLFFGFLISLLFLSFSGVLADYEGEKTFEDGYLYVTFTEDGNFTVPSNLFKLQVLVVAGGGGAGRSYGTNQTAGGGGAGGIIWIGNSSYYNVTPLEKITVIIGEGGVGATSYEDNPTGQNSSFADLVAKGGGGGGSGQNTYPPYLVPYPGGSGGGGGATSITGSPGASATQIGTFNYGNAGGYGNSGFGNFGGGGGGAGGASVDNSGTGGVGLEVWGNIYGVGGNGSGGTSSASNNTGNGGSSKSGNYNGYSGGSGVVVLRYEALESPSFISPTQDSNVTDLKVTIAWEALDDVDYYELKWDNNSAMSSYDTATFSGTNTILYLANDDWYFDIRAKLDDGNFTLWYSDINELRHFTKNDKPTFTLPEALETSPTVDFQWSVVGEITGYDLEVYNDSELNTMVYNASNWSGSFPLEVELEEDEYWARVRGRDNWYNGAWSDTLNFEVDLDEVAFDYTYNTINLYGGQTLTYDFTSMDANTTYTFKINKVTNAGVFNGNITTKIVNSDANGSGTFSYTFPSNANYPFEVRLDDNNARLFYHYVARAPSPYFYDYISGGHREIYNSTVLSVGIGDVVYNNKQGLMHDRTLTTQSLYEEGDYVLLHYSFPDSDDFPESQFIILINDLDTGDNVAAITSNDLFEYNKESANAATNFVVVSTSGVRPTIVDAEGLLDDYEGDNWSTLYLPKGAYDYIIVESQPESGDKVAFGESVLLIGDDSDVEWSLSNSPSSLKVGQKLTWTISCNTEEIWDSYNQMRFYDTPAGVYYIGSSVSPYYTKHPTAYSSSFTLAYDTSDTNGLTGGVVFGVKPESTNFEEYLKEDMTWQNTYNYGYFLTKAYTLEEVPDATETLDSWLIDIGLGTAEGKLILSMALIAIIIVLCALIGVPVAGMALIALAAFIAFIAIGFIPIWTIVILVIAMVLMLIRQFSGGGGDE